MVELKFWRQLTGGGHRCGNEETREASWMLRRAHLANGSSSLAPWGWGCHTSPLWGEGHQRCRAPRSPRSKLPVLVPAGRSPRVTVLCGRWPPGGISDQMASTTLEGIWPSLPSTGNEWSECGRVLDFRGQTRVEEVNDHLVPDLS